MRVHVLHVPGADPDRDAIVGRLSDSGDTCVHRDPDRLGLMPTWMEAIDCAVTTDRQDWSVILSDDADPLTNWKNHLERATSFSPWPFLGLTHFGGYGRTPLEKGAPYGEGPNLLWGGAMAIHSSFMAELALWAAGVVRELRYPHDDYLVMAFARRKKMLTALTARAIFGQPITKSLLGHNTPIRSPATTIVNSLGPDYRTSPRAVRVSRTIPSSVVELSRFDPRPTPIWRN